jgi:glycerol-3-phosphate dehydrogenase
MILRDVHTVYTGDGKVKRFIESYDGRPFDLIVVGGGITGACVAYDAARRGLGVGLLEKKDFGWATSAATSKMIHGGLRYLANLEIGLVRESLRERRILENIAPNYVYPLPFLVPTYEGTKSNKWLIETGMLLYDILSFDKGRTWDKAKRIPGHHFLSREEALREEPNLRGEQLTGASIYYDCQSIFPERLTLAFVKSAVKHGAQVANRAEVTGFLYGKDSTITGVKVLDLTVGKEVAIEGRLTVNCGGPWADIILRDAERGRSSHTINRSEGIHLITRPLVKEYALALMTPAGRHMFLIPWRGHTLIGTTDKEYEGDPDAYRVTRESVEGFLREINECYGDGRLGYGDVLSAYGGLRPLVEDQVEGTYESSRKYEIYDNEKDGFNGLITVEGGKYTTSRRLAEKLLDRVQKKLEQKPKDALTDKEYLQGCEIEDMPAFLEEIREKHPGFDPRTIEYLGKNYGTEYKEVLAIAQEGEGLSEPVTADGEILAEVVYAARSEMVHSLKDILFRRTGLGTLGDPGEDVLTRAGEIAARELGWTDERLATELDEARQALRLPD